MINPERRDKNEPEIIEYLRLICGQHCWVYATRGQGFDGLCLYMGKVYIVEFKNPAGNRKLTKHEAEMMENCEMQGVEYWVLETTKDVDRMLGLDGK